MKRTVIKGRWVFTGPKDGLRENAYVVVEGGRIKAITGERPGSADTWIENDDALVLPGFVNIHNHSFSAPLFRSLIDDVSEDLLGGDFVYGFLMPMGAMVVRTLDLEEQRAIVELAFLGLIRTGTTTVVDMWRNPQEFFFDAAQKMGLRAYGCPYQFTWPDLEVDSDGNPVYKAGNSTGLEIAVEMFKRHDQGKDGRIRVGLGPHAIDSCSPELLRDVRRTATDLGCPIVIHAAQSGPEIAEIRRRHNKTPIEHLRDLDFLGPDVITAHCIYATDSDLAILKDAGATIATCPLTYARMGITAPFHRFREHGVRVGLGTDGYGLDMLNEMHGSGLLAKTREKRGDTGAARELIECATFGGARALGRSDLGVIEPGARADLLVVDMHRPHLYPAWDPIRTLLWNGSGNDIVTVLIDGEVLLRDGRFVRSDEQAILKRGAAALEKAWSIASERGILKRWPTRGIDA